VYAVDSTATTLVISSKDWATGIYVLQAGGKELQIIEVIGL